MIPKFRAWIKEENEMWPVHAIVYDNKTVWVEEPDDEDPSGLLEFDDVILMQSTGLKDKNGKEIFEGDVVQYQNTKVPSADSKGVIRYFDNWAMFGIDIEHNEPRALFFNGLADHISLDVVGNTYENPELLE